LANCRVVIARYITFGQPEPIVVVVAGAINMRSTAIHCEVQYSNRFDITTATIETHRGVLVGLMIKQVAQLTLFSINNLHF